MNIVSIALMFGCFQQPSKSKSAEGASAVEKSPKEVPQSVLSELKVSEIIAQEEMAKRYGMQVMTLDVEAHTESQDKARITVVSIDLTRIDEWKKRIQAEGFVERVTISKFTSSPHQSRQAFELTIELIIHHSVKKPEKPEQSKPPLQQYTVKQYKLKAVYLNGDTQYALLENPEKRSYLVQVGDYVGKRWSKITAIEKNRIVLVADIVSSDGILKQERTLELEKPIVGSSVQDSKERSLLIVQDLSIHEICHLLSAAYSFNFIATVDWEERFSLETQVEDPIALLSQLTAQKGLYLTNYRSFYLVSPKSLSIPEASTLPEAIQISLDFGHLQQHKSFYLLALLKKIPYILVGEEQEQFISMRVKNTSIDEVLEVLQLIYADQFHVTLTERMLLVRTK